MDRNVCVRFYQVLKNCDDDLDFSIVLQRLYDEKFEAWINIYDDVTIRLERFDPRGGTIKGEFSRKQQHNLPPRANGDGDPLEPNPDPVAHRAAFQYHPQLSILALESNSRGMTLSKLNKLIKKEFSHNGFEYLPVPTDQAWTRLENCEPRKLTLKIAVPENANILETENRTLLDNLEAFTEHLGGPVVEINVGFGRRREGLLDRQSLNRLIAEVMRRHESTRDVEKIQISALGEEEPIDLLLEQLKEKRVLNLDDSNVDRHYNERKLFIEETFNRHFSRLHSVYSRAA
jgi:hypothetical protein